MVSGRSSSKGDNLEGGQDLTLSFTFFPAAVFLYRDSNTGELSTTTEATTNDQQMVSLNSSSRCPEGAAAAAGRRPVAAKRDERRRATHNEVERRRRDKINSWIMKLGSIIPDNSNCESPSSRHVDGLSKGGILAAACEFINELKDENQNLNRHKIEVSALCETSQFLVEENTRLQLENQQLKAILERHGIQFQLESPEIATKDDSEGVVAVNNENTLS